MPPEEKENLMRRERQGSNSCSKYAGDESKSRNEKKEVAAENK